MSDKAMIAAFYRELYEGKKTTKEYADQAVGRLAILLRQFRMENKSFPGPVQNPWEFFSYYAELNWFPRHKKMLKGLPDNMLIGKVDLEFKSFLREEQYKTRPLIDPKEMPKPKPKPKLQTETEPFGVDIPLKPEVRIRRRPDGNWTIDGRRADHSHVKTILKFRKPTEEEKDSDRRESKEELERYQQLIRQLDSGGISIFGIESDEVLQAMREHFIRQIDHPDDTEQKLEDAWRARDALDVINKAIEKARQDKALKKNKTK